MGVPKGTVHRHLERLVDGGFVDRLDDERMWVYYELTDSGRSLAASDRPRIVINLGWAVTFLMAGLVAIGWAVALPLVAPADPGPVEPPDADAPPPGPSDEPGLSIPVQQAIWAGIGGVLVLTGVVWIRRLRRPLKDSHAALA